MLLKYFRVVVKRGSKAKIKILKVCDQKMCSSQAEIMAASEAAKEAVYLTSFLEELDEGSVQGPRRSVSTTKPARDLAYLQSRASSENETH